MVRPEGWSGCGSSPTVLLSCRGVIIGRKNRVTFESKLTAQTAFKDRSFGMWRMLVGNTLESTDSHPEFSCWCGMEFE